MTRTEELKDVVRGCLWPAGKEAFAELCALYESELARKDAALSGARLIADGIKSDAAWIGRDTHAIDAVIGLLDSALTPARETGET